MYELSVYVSIFFIIKIMLFDLWSSLLILIDFSSFALSSLTPSIPSLLALIILITLSYFVWKSTDTPQVIPNPSSTSNERTNFGSGDIIVRTRRGAPPNVLRRLLYFRPRQRLPFIIDYQRQNYVRNSNLRQNSTHSPNLPSQRTEIGIEAIVELESSPQNENLTSSLRHRNLAHRVTTPTPNSPRNLENHLGEESRSVSEETTVFESSNLETSDLSSSELETDNNLDSSDRLVREEQEEIVRLFEEGEEESQNSSKTESRGGVNSEERSEMSEEVKFTLKFLNDTQIETVTVLGEKIGDFKRRVFLTELNSNKTVRLIFNGRVLSPESLTLAQCGIFPSCVVHCLIVPSPSHATDNSTSYNNSSNSTNSTSNSSNNSSNSTTSTNRRMRSSSVDGGIFIIFLLSLLLTFFWYLSFSYGAELFTQSAIISLSILTAIFIVAIIAFYLPPHPPPRANISANSNANVNINANSASVNNSGGVSVGSTG